MIMIIIIMKAKHIKRIRKDFIKIVSWHRKEWHKDKEGEKALINMRCKISNKWFMTIMEV